MQVHRLPEKQGYAVQQLPPQGTPAQTAASGAGAGGRGASGGGAGAGAGALQSRVAHAL
jgi:hypothetical protein